MQNIKERGLKKVFKHTTLYIELALRVLEWFSMTFLASFLKTETLVMENYCPCVIILLTNVSHRCDPGTIRDAYNDIKFYILMRDPFQSNATMLNRNLTPEQLDQFLEGLFNSLSPGLQRIIRTMRSPDGRRVVPIADDTTYLPVTKGNDTHWQQDAYSGRLNKGHVIKVGTWTAPDGRPIASRPGPQIGCTPRGGDELSAARQLDQWTRSGQFGEGFTSLIVGGRNWTMAYNVDMGFR